MTAIPDEAVEAAARALCVVTNYGTLGPRCDTHEWVVPIKDPTHCEYGDEIARAALTAAAPLIAAQATTNDPRKVAHIQCDCVPDLGPSHCHLCSERAGREMPWSEAHPDLRARLEALRDEWNRYGDVANDDGYPLEAEHYYRNANALDALIGGE